MKLIHTENYEAMSKEAADLLLDTLRKKPDAVICLCDRKLTGADV